MTTNKKKHVLIIGNGFDLDFGLNTRYQDFLDYSDRLTHSQNKLISEYHTRSTRKGITKWIDMEAELIAIANDNIFADKIEFSRWYYDVKAGLVKYMRIVNSAIGERRHKIGSEAEKLISCIVQEKSDFMIYDFNYTNTVPYLLEKYGMPSVDHKNHYKRVHGSADDNKIIFGIHDESGVSPHWDFLFKTMDDEYTKTRIWSPVLHQKFNVTVFGHSLGEIDNRYFSTFFQAGSLQNSEVHFKVYTHKDYVSNIKQRIFSLTDKKMGDFKNSLESFNLIPLSED